MGINIIDLGVKGDLSQSLNPWKAPAIDITASR